MKKRWWLAVVIVVLVIGGGGLAWRQYQATRPTSGVPTVFVHGYSGTAGSTNQMIAALARSGVAKRTMRVTVTTDGQLQVQGNLHGKNPIVQVVYQDNRNGKQFTNWLLKVYAMLHRRYHVQRVNAVGHSAGAIAVIQAAMQHPAVKMAKLVTIAGPFNGFFARGTKPKPIVLDKNGKPQPETANYRQLSRKAKNFQASAVLNLYGNLEDGSHSDGVVPINAAKSLRYLLRDWYGDYHEHEVRGPRAQHSKLHENNATVDSQLRTFLFTANNR